MDYDVSGNPDLLYMSADSVYRFEISDRDVDYDHERMGTGRPSGKDSGRHPCGKFRAVSRNSDYVQYYKRINGFTNLIGNVCAFIPLGILFCVSVPQHTKKALPVLYCGVFSLAIELFQLVTLFGIFDVDDIILNTLGGFLGYLIFLLVRCIWVRLKGDYDKR